MPMAENPGEKAVSTKLALSWLAVAAVLIAVFYAASAAIAPFLIAIVIAYMGVPAVDKLAGMGMGRTVATCVVVALLMLVILLLPLALLPIVISQVIDVARGLPDAFASAWAWLGAHVPGIGGKDLTGDELGKLTEQFSLGASLEKAVELLGSVGRNLGAFVGFVATLLITPLVTFFLMRDWHGLITATANNIPARILPTVSQIATIADRTLSEFLRGQLTVMLLMAVVYSVLLGVAGTPFAVAIGVITGLLCFIPYIGFLFGLGLVVIVTALNFETWAGVLWPLVALTAGTLVESFWLTPKIVGERSGLGPVTVLLALSVMGSLFGMAGMLVAIPLAAVLLAVWRFYLPKFTERDIEDAV